MYLYSSIISESGPQINFKIDANTIESLLRYTYEWKQNQEFIIEISFVLLLLPFINDNLPLPLIWE